MIYDLLIVFSSPFLTDPLKIVALTALITDLLNSLQILIKYVIKLAKNFNFCANGLVVKHRKGRSEL